MAGRVRAEDIELRVVRALLGKGDQAPTADERAWGRHACSGIERTPTREGDRRNAQEVYRDPFATAGVPRLRSVMRGPLNRANYLSAHGSRHRLWGSRTTRSFRLLVSPNRLDRRIVLVEAPSRERPSDISVFDRLASHSPV